MFERIEVIGSGRVGAAVAARLRERGLLAGSDADLVLLCVPDTSIESVAQGLTPGPWVGHVSGATVAIAL